MEVDNIEHTFAEHDDEMTLESELNSESFPRKNNSKKILGNEEEIEVEDVLKRDVDGFVEEELDRDLNFHEMEIDNRILKAIADLGWEEPTFIQGKAIPILLRGSDVLMKARTGSGKTAAFAIPAIQKILNIRKYVSKTPCTRVLVLAPTHELCSQIHKNFQELSSCCSNFSTCLITSQISFDDQVPLLRSQPDVVVGLPVRIFKHIVQRTLHLTISLEMLVIDEADLIFCFGYEKCIKGILSFLPSVYQSVLASATLSDQVESLKRCIMHNPVTVKLTENVLLPSGMTHYYLDAEEDDKAVSLYIILKLKLVMGRTLIFVNTVDKCYKLKLYLEQFGISSCLINSELPANVRYHSVGQFNSGKYNIIIASDEWTRGPDDKKKDKNQDKNKNKKQAKSKRKKDKESGVTRGIDFKEVSNVINFDFPKDVNSYIHRAGRTARGNNKGTVLSLVKISEQLQFKTVEETIQKTFGSDLRMMKKFKMNMEELDGFRYRSQDAWRAVTRVAVREARLKEIKQELLNSTALKGYFEDNPRDYSSLRHDRALHTVKLQSHLHDVPKYLVPQELHARSEKLLWHKEDRRRSTLEQKRTTKTQKRFKKMKEDPLSLHFTPKNKLKEKLNI